MRSNWKDDQMMETADTLSRQFQFNNSVMISLTNNTKQIGKIYIRTSANIDFDFSQIQTNPNKSKWHFKLPNERLPTVSQHTENSLFISFCRYILPQVSMQLKIIGFYEFIMFAGNCCW